MDSPPAKRQRRLKAAFSEDEELELDSPQQVVASGGTQRSTSAITGKANRPQDSTKSTRSKAKSKSNNEESKATRRKVASKAESVSPKTSQKSPGKKTPEKKSTSLHTFFARASEEQRWNRKAADTPNKEADDVKTPDAIEDDDESSDETFPLLGESKGDMTFQLDRRKDRVAWTRNGSPTFRTGLSVSNQKFVKPPVPTVRRSKLKADVEESSNTRTHRPWADRYGPANLEELAVHRKKVGDLQKWLDEVLNGRDPRKILVLKGPAGSGKTTCLALLSTTLNFQAVHWSNPTVSDTNRTASVAWQFDDFVNRGGNFASLGFALNSCSPDAPVDDQSGALPRVLVVEEFPSNMTRISSALDAFRAVLSRYLATGTSASNSTFQKGVTSLDTRPPIVLIVSESLLTSATGSADSFTAHRLLGAGIMNHPLVTVIEFNTVAPTLIAKALDLVIKKEARCSRRRRIPGPAILRKLGEMGDVRSAVNALEFLCAKSAASADWSGTVAAKMKKSGKSGPVLTPMEENSLELITQREATLGMFHAVGKVVYNKREDPQIADPKAEPPPKPPDHLAHMHRPKICQLSIDDLMNETGTDMSTFSSALHENYLLSCNGPSFLGSCDNCIAALSDSDILSPEARSMSRAGYGRGLAGNGLSHAGGIDMLRQNEIGFHIAVRGLLFSLPHPVNRATYPGGRKADTFKMFYPTSLRLWKPMEEMESLISQLMDDWSFASTIGTISGKSSATGVASWKQKNDAFGTNPENPESLGMPRIIASRADMLYDRLPYISKLSASQDPHMGKIKQVTQFQGAIYHNEDDSEEAGTEAATDLSAADEITDRLPNPPTGRDRIMTVGPGKESSRGAALRAVRDDVELEKLYISDDDIQDD